MYIVTCNRTRYIIYRHTQTDTHMPACTQTLTSEKYINYEMKSYCREYVDEENKGDCLFYE